MHLTGLHLLLTYQCTFECDHCFVWGSPWQNGTMTLSDIRRILQQATDLGTVKSIYFEGGEPFLYYAVMLEGVRMANRLGFQVGIVSNSYWATSEDDAVEWLRPLTGLIQDLSVSSDLYHWDERLSQQARNAAGAAENLGIPIGFISIAQPDGVQSGSAENTEPTGQIPAASPLSLSDSGIMYRGRAAEKLIDRAHRHPWEQFTECPHEDLREPGRVHVDPFGNLHICQGISIGNLYRTPLLEICETYAAESHSITGPLVKGGPAELVRKYGLLHEESYADACHLCFEARKNLRGRFKDILGPDQMYAEPDS